MTIWEWSGYAGATDFVEVETEVIGLLWLSLGRKIPYVIVLAVFIQKDSFSVIWEKFDIWSCLMFVKMIPIIEPEWNYFMNWEYMFFVGGLCCHWAEFIETVDITK